ncbi:MAG: ribulose-phosphate 3-epimerase [Leptospiraceae bacterium]|nr:ribulose-phosphate 3-epimerase [Leptospiraceae bacterium]
MDLSPSILAADLTDLKSSLHQLEGKVEYLHMDIMDGHFVPTLSFGELYTKLLKQHTEIPLDVHLMVSRPEKEVPKYFDLSPANITFHVEATDFSVRLAREIRKQGIKAGVSLNPATSLASLDYLLDEIDLVLIMSVEPGFYGQSFIQSSLEKIRQLRELIGDRDITIEVDGGIDASNIGRIIEAGARRIVAGSACFKGGDIAGNISRLRDAAAVSLDSKHAS